MDPKPWKLQESKHMQFKEAILHIFYGTMR
jgi:hypothetical protein